MAITIVRNEGHLWSQHPHGRAIPHYAVFFAGSMALEAAESLGPDHYVIDRHGLQLLHGMAAVSRDAKLSVSAMTLSGFSKKFACEPLL
jgi:hypothetical protein